MTPTCVVFDLGGVLVRWDPRLLYRQVLASDEEVDAFLDEIDFPSWNRSMDAGERTWSEAVETLAVQFPHRRDLIAAYPARFAETLDGAISGTVSVLRELHASGLRCLALTNWSAETFPVARARLDFLDLFEAVVVSGEERLAKPDPAIFDLMLDRFGLDPTATVFIDDSAANIDAARAIGLQTVHFVDPDALRRDLNRLGLLDGGGSC